MKQLDAGAMYVKNAAGSMRSTDCASATAMAPCSRPLADACVLNQGFFSTSPQRYRSPGAQVGESTVDRWELRAGWTQRGSSQTEEATGTGEAGDGGHAGEEDASGEL